MLASSKPIHCFSPLGRKLDVGWPRIEDFQLRGHSCVNNVQRCLCHFYTWMRHSKQTATLLLTKHHANFDTSTSAKGYARVCTNCACAIVVLGILLAQARPTMPCIHLVYIYIYKKVPLASLEGGSLTLAPIIIIVRPSPARRAWSHEVCRASHSLTWLP